MTTQRLSWIFACALSIALLLSACGSGSKTAAPPEHAGGHEQAAAGQEKPADSGTTAADDGAGSPSGGSESAAKTDTGKTGAPAEDNPSRQGAGDDHPKPQADDKRDGHAEDHPKPESEPKQEPKQEQNQDPKQQPKPGEKSGTGGQAGQTPDKSQAAVHVVEIKDFAFQPAKLEIRAGDSVTFINRDSVKHTATSDDGTSFDTGLLAQDKEKQVTFSKAGEFGYYCVPHPAMKGTIVVTAP